MKNAIVVFVITLLGTGWSFAQQNQKAGGPGPGQLTPTNKEQGKLANEKMKDPMFSKVPKPDMAKKSDDLRRAMPKKDEFKRPKRMEKPELPSAVKDQISAVKELEKNLHSQIDAKIKELGKDATKEQIKTAVEAYKEANKDKFEEIKTAHDAIRQDLEAARPPKPQRPELSSELKAKVDVLKEKRKEMEVAQKELHKNLKDATEAERKTMIADFKASNKEKHQEIKTKAKEVKMEIRGLVESQATRTSDL